MDAFLSNAISSAGQHLGNVIKMLVEGVAFRVNGATFEVYSYEGDVLGEITTADLSFAICYVKRLGRPVGKLKHFRWNNETKTYSTTYEPAFTFAWQGWHPDGL
jgi:hypothetical protein